MIKLHDGLLILTIHRRYVFLSLDVMQLLLRQSQYVNVMGNVKYMLNIIT